MAEDDDKVMVELELARDQVSVHPAENQDGQSGEPKKDEALKEIEKHKKQAREELSETRRELRKTQKAVEELKEKVEEKPESSEEESGGETLVKQATGYEASEIITAPFSPSDPEAKKKPKLSQLRLILVGFVVVFLGVVLWPVFTFSVGLAIIIVGAVLVAVGVLIRV